MFRKGISNALGNFLGTFDYELGGILQLPRGIQDGLVHTVSSVNSGLLGAIVQLLSSIGVLATVLFLYISISYFKNRRGKVKTQPLRTVRMD